MASVLAIFIVALTIGTAALIAFLRHSHSISEYGPVIARQRLPVDLALAILLALQIPNDSFRTALYVSCAILIWGLLIKQWFYRPETSKVLLNLGRFNQRPGWFLAICGLLGTIMIAVGLARSTTENVYLSGGILFWSLGIVYASQKEALLTETGVQAGYGNFTWDQVTSYTWSDSKNKKLYLGFTIQTRLPLINAPLLRIPVEYAESVNDILAQHAPKSAHALESMSRVASN